MDTEHMHPPYLIASLSLVWSLFLASSMSVAATAGDHAPAQAWFTAHNGTNEESHGHFIIACDDGGYLQVGETGFVGSNAKLFVVKTHADGSLHWQRQVGSGNKNMGNSALEVSDGYLICGMLSRNSAILKLDKDTGDVLWQQTHDLGGADAFEHVALTDTGLLAVGYTNAEDPNSTFFAWGQGRVTLLDATGTLLSTHSVNDYLAQPYRVQRAGDAYIIAGPAEDALDYGVLKIDADMNVLWHATYGGTSHDHCFGMDTSSDGSIFLAGHTVSGTANWDTYTIKLSPDGAVLWERIVGNPRGFDPLWIHDESWGVRATCDGGCIIAAGTGDEYSYSECDGAVCSDQWEAYVVKFAANGEVEWHETYAVNPGDDWAGEDMALTSDGGAIVAVDNGSFGFLKLEPFLACDEACVGDVNGDGARTVDDLLQILAAFGTSDAGDVDGDGDTDVADILSLLAVYGQPC